MPRREIKKYKFAVIAVDPVIFALIDGRLQVLLIKMKKAPFTDMWAAPGGLIKGNESLDEAVIRLVKEKTGIADTHFEQLYTFGDVKRDPFGRVVSVAYMALILQENMKLKTTEEYKDIAWFPVNKLPALAYDHKEIIKVAEERLQMRLGYSNIICSLLPREFTLTALQKAYEVILEKKMDKRNFRKKILSLKLLKKTGGKEGERANRPAWLYTFPSKRITTVEIL